MTLSRNLIAAASLGLGLALLPQLASAQSVPFPGYDGDRPYEENSISRAPRHGYTGWARAPFGDYFCDYQRLPVRRCDNGGCRVVAWRLRQYCY